MDATRLALNAAKSALKAARPDKIAPAQAEMQRAEEEFNWAVQDATNKMRLVVDSVSVMGVSCCVHCWLFSSILSRLI